MSNMNYMYATLRCTWGLCLVLLGWWWWWWDSAELSLLLRSLPLCPLWGLTRVIRVQSSHVDGGSLFIVATCSGVPKNGIVSCGAMAWTQEKLHNTFWGKRLVIGAISSVSFLHLSSSSHSQDVGFKQHQFSNIYPPLSAGSRDGFMFMPSFMAPRNIEFSKHLEMETDTKIWF